MHDWLVRDCPLLGVPAQNWMWLVAAGIAGYLLVLALIERGHRSL